MKSYFALFLLLPAFVSAAETDAGQVCINLPEIGIETTKIENTCKKGDVISVNKKHMAYLCDFKHAVVNLNSAEKYACVYLGEQRKLREGTYE